MSRIRALIAAIVALCLVAGTAPTVRAEDARVTIVTILASTTHQEINDKLKNLAAEVKKHDPSLTGFKLHDTAIKALNVGQKESFNLIADASADVTVLEKYEAKQRVKLLVKPPLVGEITYTIGYNKFFPIVTRFMSGNDRLIIAIMVQPPKDKDKDKDSGAT